MSKLGISTGTNVNDGTGDSLIDGAVKVNKNFDEVYNLLGDGTTLSSPVTSLVAGTGINISGSTGDVTITNTGIAQTANINSDSVNVSGVVTASSFVGNGSNLTGVLSNILEDTSPQLGGNLDLNSKNITGTGNINITGSIEVGTGVTVSTSGIDAVGIITASSFSGDGSSLTGIVGAASTDNIVTGTAATFTGGINANLITIGAGTSTGNISTPGLTLSHNNPTVIGTAGTVGQIKQIGGQPYYYDGTAWRALFLAGAASTVNQADSDWDNTMLRFNFDQANIGSVTNLKDGRTPTVSGGTVDLVASPVKYGSRSLRMQGSGGFDLAQNNGGSVYYSFEGAWTMEGWFYFDTSNLPTVTTCDGSSVMFCDYEFGSIGDNWSIGVYLDSTNLYNFYWQNNNGTGAIQTNLGFVMAQLTTAEFANSGWHHFAFVRESENGSIHMYFDGTESTDTSSNQLIDLSINDDTSKDFSIGRYLTSGDSRYYKGMIDDVRVSKIARYTSNFTPPTSALPITGSTTTVYAPADSKVGEITLGNSPAWTGTPGITPTRVAAGHYRATFATAYTNANDYVIQASMNDYTPVTTAVGIGISRAQTYADFYVNRVSDGATIDTGSLAIDLFKK